MEPKEQLDCPLVIGSNKGDRLLLPHFTFREHVNQSKNSNAQIYDDDDNPPEIETPDKDRREVCYSAAADM